MPPLRIDDDLKYFASPEFRELLDRFLKTEESGHMGYFDADELTDIAEYYSMVEKDEQRSREIVDWAITLHPDAVDPQVLRARQSLIEMDYDRAEELCDQIQDQDHREVIFLRAELSICRQKPDEALAYLMGILDHGNVEDTDYFLYDGAYIFIDYEYFKQAMVLAQKLEEIAPQWFKTWHLKADVLLELEQCEAALPYIERMLDVDSFYVEAWNWRAEAYLSLDDLSEAATSLDYALAVDPDCVRSIQLKAWLMVLQHRSEEAHALYARLQQDDPDNIENWINDSNLLLDSDRPQEALDVIHQILPHIDDASHDDRIMLLQQECQCYSALGLPQQAMLSIDTIESELQDGDEAYRIDCLLLRGMVYLQENQLDKSQPLLNRAIETDNNKASAQYRVAALYFDFGYFGLAQVLFETIERKLKSPGSDDDGTWLAQCHAYMAYCCHATKDYAGAERYIALAAKEHARNLATIFEGVLPASIAWDDYVYYYRDAVRRL